MGTYRNNLNVKFSATLTANTAVNGAWVKIVFNSEQYDTANAFANGTFTAPAAGYYKINTQAGIGIAGLSVAANTALTLRKNGVDTVYATQVNGSGDAHRLPRLLIATTLLLAANDTIEVWGWCSEARDIQGDARITYIQGEYLGPV